MEKDAISYKYAVLQENFLACAASEALFYIYIYFFLSFWDVSGNVQASTESKMHFGTITYGGPNKALLMDSLPSVMCVQHWTHTTPPHPPTPSAPRGWRFSPVCALYATVRWAEPLILWVMTAVWQPEGFHLSSKQFWDQTVCIISRSEKVVLQDAGLWK